MFEPKKLSPSNVIHGYDQKSKHSTNQKDVDSSVMNFGLFNNDIFENYANYNNLYEFRTNFRLKDTDLNSSETIRFNVNDLNSYNHGSAIIDVDGVDFNTFLFDSNVKKLYVSLTSGTRKKGQDVLFTRWKWRRYFNGFFLLIDDPMFEFIKDFPKNIMGWFYGTSDNNFLDKTAKLILEIAKSLDIKVQDITLIGSSSGGTASLYLSNKLDGCLSIAFNPQSSLSDWPYAKDFEKATNVNLLAPDPRNKITINPNSKSKFFIYYNLISDSDSVQMHFLLESMGLHNFKVKYGLNKLSDNVYLLASVINSHKRHTTAPDEYETFIISEFLNMDSRARDHFTNSGFFTYMSESISKRFEMLKVPNRLKKENLFICSQYLDYATKAFERNYKLNNYEALLDDYKSLFALETFNLSNSYFKKVVLSLNKLNYSKKQIGEYFASCTSNSINIVTNIADKVKSGKFDLYRTVSDFGNVVETLYASSSVASRYKEAFYCICNAILGKEVPCYEEDNTFNINYVISSDSLESSNLTYLENINKNDFFFVKPKCDLIGFKRGIAGFINNVNSKDLLIAQTVDFFFKNLIGCSNFRSVPRFKQIHTAYGYSHKTGKQIEYADNVKRVSLLLANIIVAKDPKKLITNLASEMIKLIVIGLDLPRNKYLVFEKLTHVGMENCVDYLPFIHRNKIDNFVTQDR